MHASSPHTMPLIAVRRGQVVGGHTSPIWGVGGSGVVGKKEAGHEHIRLWGTCKSWSLWKQQNISHCKSFTLPTCYAFFVVVGSAIRFIMIHMAGALSKTFPPPGWSDVKTQTQHAGALPTQRWSSAYRQHDAEQVSVSTQSVSALLKTLPSAQTPLLIRGSDC
jgi:hypothetical protein